ncbi:MAG: polysaccharide lyase family 1 protein [Micromonosporaceae bacterium]
MRTSRMLLPVLTAALLLPASAASATAPTASAAAQAKGGAAGVGRLAELVGRQPLAPGDGWAAEGAGTTGGSAADASHVFVVSTRAELAAALAGDEPKIVYVRGVIDGFTAADGSALDCADFADPEYSLAAYLAAYDPATWGRVAPSGPLEEARLRSRANQAAHTVLNVGANTTIVGLPGATLKRLTLMVDRVSNVIIRNLDLRDAADCFPAWSPTDGEFGAWNSEYDLISVRRSTNVWVDHNTFSDGDNPDSAQPRYFGQPYQVHDGALDITHTADLVTVSYNVFTNHDKTMLIGSSNTVGPDVGKLRVTLRHNVFDGVGQRAPRIRFGRIDIYNNLYKIRQPYEYSVGIGVQSAGYLENNYFVLADGIAPADVLYDWSGTALTERGSWVKVGSAPARPLSLLDAYNAEHDPDFGDDAGWAPTLRAYRPLPAPAVPGLTQHAGAGRLLP